MKVVRTNDVPWTNALTRGKYANRRKELGGGERLGCGLWELPPGKKSFPLHAHLVTEEALFVVSGRAQVRTPDGLTPIGPGDFVAFPAGGPAHQLVNDGTEPLVYVGISAKTGADVVEYPESGKVAAAVGTRPADARRWLLRQDAQPDYFEGDPDAS
ncbi:MAG TPA: cupin domain-containing protein [Aggregicoccus sp.]|nr:cupin domain-containing protein [Aggregicoccus sp.]